MTDDQIKQYHEQVENNITKFGYHTTYVFADKTPSFCYSTGIYHSFGIPEVFISSLPQNLSHELIENYLNKFRNEDTVSLDKKIEDLTHRFPVYLIQAPTDKLSEYVLSSIRFYKDRDYKYVQLIYPDTKYRFPNDIGYNYDQIIIGQFKN